MDWNTVVKEIPEQDRLWHSAYHESGHAVAACLLNVPFLYTTINPPEEIGCPGYTKMVPNANLTQQEVLDNMAVLASGMIAATFYPEFGFRDRDLYTFAGSDDDSERIREYAARLATDDSEYTQFVDQARRRANELLRNPTNRRAVIKVAETLLEKKILSSEEVQQIIADIP